eukprot:1160619-Pelagomonas_calceolata.AAC.3
MVHSNLPRPTQRNPCPGTRHAVPAEPSGQPHSARGVGEAVVDVVEVFVDKRFGEMGRQSLD